MSSDPRMARMSRVSCMRCPAAAAMDAADTTVAVMMPSPFIIHVGRVDDPGVKRGGLHSGPCGGSQSKTQPLRQARTRSRVKSCHSGQLQQPGTPMYGVRVYGGPTVGRSRWQTN